MTAAQGRLAMIYAGRAIAGLGIGASSLTVPGESLCPFMIER